MRWLTITVLQMSAAYAVLDPIWQARWTILAAGVVGGLVAALVGLWLVRSGAGQGRRFASWR